MVDCKPPLFITMLLLVILWCQGTWQTDRVFMNHSLQMALLVFRQLWAQVAWGLNRGFLPGRTPWELAAFISLVPISPWQQHYFTKPTFNKLHPPGKNLEIFNTLRTPVSQFDFYSFPEDARRCLEQTSFVCTRLCFPPQLKKKKNNNGLCSQEYLALPSEWFQVSRGQFTVSCPGPPALPWLMTAL